MDTKRGGRDREPPQDRGAVKRAVKQIERSPALHAKYELLRAALKKAAIDELAGRYAAGQVVAEVKLDQKKYGQKAVHLLAIVLGVSASSLYEAAQVASTFSAGEVATLVERTNGFGLPITYSHLVLLARVKPAAKRAALLERAHHEGLTVRDIQAEIAAATPKSVPTSNPEKTVRTASRAFSSLEKNAEELLEAVRELARQDATDDLRALGRSYPAVARLFAELAPLLPKTDEDELPPTPAKTKTPLEGLWGQKRGEA